jgi:hypothetical protein
VRKLIALAMLAGIGACAGAPVPDDGAINCDAAKAQSLIGQVASSELAAQAQRLTGASVVRWLLPGQVVTMEYRADRLSIVLDASNRVQAVRCG